MTTPAVWRAAAEQAAAADGELFPVPEVWWQRRRCPVCSGALSVTHAATYVVQRQGWVKIGATSNVRRRVNELARPAWTQHLVSPAAMDWLEPLYLVRQIEGDVEHELHQRWAKDHVKGEWFLPGKAMRKWLNDKHTTTIELGFPR